jgi:hypothetical protein
LKQLSKQERRELRRQRRREKREAAANERNRSVISGNMKTIGFAVIIVIALAYLSFMISASPGAYDGFTKCLTEKGTVVYGNDWCEYTKVQKADFGNSFKYLNYVICDSNKELCNAKGVEITPTWEIGGKTYSGVQTFGKLSEVSGCEI